MGNPANFEPAMTLADLPSGALRACRIGGRDLVLCRTAGGVSAFDDLCPHAEARMSEGRLRGTKLLCPLHGAAFDASDGRVLGGPARAALRGHPVLIEGDRVLVAVADAVPAPTRT
jgi:3-phenylpropionate/trans-cinnamate dioxygenase ferredoxin subunit